MPKPERIEAHLERWLAENGDDALVSWVRLEQVSVNAGSAPGSHTTMSATSADPGWAKAAMGFGDRENALVLGYRHAVVRTRSKILVLHLTVFKERPKRLWVEASVDGSRLYHLDAPAPRGHVVRYLALELPDGVLAPNGKPAPFILDSFVVRSKGGEPSPLAELSDRFIASFGAHAHEVTAP